MKAPSTAAIVVVGTELLLEGRVDSNGPVLALALAEEGFRPALKITVGDDLEAIASALGRAAEVAGLVVACGGLGPTFDDLTREAAARAFGLRLERRAPEEEAIRARYAKRGLFPPETAMRMAEVLEGAEILDNSVGSAPGQMLPGPPAVALLPGVPAELEAMLREQLLPRLRDLAPGPPAARRVFKIAGLYESQVETMVRPHLQGRSGIDTTILASPGQITLILRADPGAGEIMEEAVRQVRGTLGEAVYAEKEEGIEVSVGRLLETRGLSLGTAESCTAGLLGAMITSVPGSSRWYRGGFVCYSDRLKEEMLGVPRQVISDAGAVSAETAEAMAAGARERLDVDFALSLTGVAGPGGGTPDKPVGLVWLGLAGPAGRTSRRLHLGGSRQVIREISCRAALDLLRRTVGGSP